MNEGCGQITGIRQFGRLGVQHQGNGILQSRAAEDLGDKLLVVLKAKVLRREILSRLSTEDLEILKFVEKARELRQLSKTHKQERALRLAATLYKMNLSNRVVRKFDGIGQQDRTSATAALWHRARQNSDQLRSYAVLEEMLEVATQKTHLLGLTVIPNLVVGNVDFEKLKEETHGDEKVRTALETIQSTVPVDPESWLAMFRSLVDRVKAAVVLSDMTVPGCPMICVNSAFCTITGYAREEAEGRNCRFLQGPATQLESLRVIQRTLSNAKDCQVAIYNYRKNGQIFMNLLSMRPVLDLDGEYTYNVAVQFEVDETCLISQRRKLRLLHDLLEMLPKTLPFRRTNMRDRLEPTVPVVIPRYKPELEQKAKRRYEFFFTRLKWLTNPLNAMTRLLSIKSTQQLISEIIKTDDRFSSPASLFAFEHATKTTSAFREMSIRTLSRTFLPAILNSMKGVEFVGKVSNVEDVGDLVVRNSKTDSNSKTTRRHDIGLGEEFFQCFANAMRESPVSCIAADVMAPGLQLIFANPRFLRLAGVSSENDVIGKNCRFLQGDVSHTCHQYLIEEISTAIRERRSVLVKMFNYTRGRVFQNFIALHPIFATDGGEYLYQIGMQVNMNDVDEVVEAKLAELEQTLAYLPETVDTSSLADQARTPVGDKHSTDDSPTHLFKPPDCEIAHPAPGCPTSPVDVSNAVMWKDMPQSSCLDPTMRQEIEEKCLDAIEQFTRVKWLEDPSATTEALLRQQGVCHDAFAGFAANRSRVAKALVRCWDIIQDILTAPTIQEQRRLALNYHSVWEENPLFLFSQTEIPVGALSKLDFDWDPIIKLLPLIQSRCARILSVNVLPAFLQSDFNQNLMCRLLGHPQKESAEFFEEKVDVDSQCAFDIQIAQKEVEESPAIPDVDPNLYTAAHHPQFGVPLTSVSSICARDVAAFWYEMALNLLGDDDESSPREENRLESLNGVVIDSVRREKMFLSPRSSPWLSSLVSHFGEVIVDEIRKVLEEDRSFGPRTGIVADGRVLLFIQSIEDYDIVLSIKNSEECGTSFEAVGRFYQHAPRTFTGKCRHGKTAFLADFHNCNAQAQQDTPRIEVVTPMSTVLGLSPRNSPSKKERPSTAPSANRSVVSFANTISAEGGVLKEICSLSSRPPEPLQGLKSSAARGLIQKINRKLNDYVEERRMQHDKALNHGEQLALGGEDEERRSQCDGRSSVGLSTSQHLANLVQERTALWRDGLMEKALELDETIAQLQAAHRKQRMRRLSRVLANAKQKIEHQHQLRLRALGAKHKQERMALEKQIEEGVERLKQQHQKQTADYINEVMTKTGATNTSEAETAGALEASKPYLKKGQQFSIRTTTKPPEMVHQLKMAKHLRRKRRFAEADDAERIAREIDLEKTKTICETVKKAATGTRLQIMIQQQESAQKIFQRRQHSRVLNMQRRHEAAVSNQENLLRIEQSKMEKVYRAKFTQNSLDLGEDEEDDEMPRVSTTKVSPRPPSAPSVVKRGGGSLIRRGNNIARH